VQPPDGFDLNPKEMGKADGRHASVGESRHPLNSDHAHPNPALGQNQLNTGLLFPLESLGPVIEDVTDGDFTQPLLFVELGKLTEETFLVPVGLSVSLFLVDSPASVGWFGRSDLGTTPAAAALRTLRNPLYAGAFCFGRWRRWKDSQSIEHRAWFIGHLASEPLGFC
jgi:hypothetical protein